MLCGVNALTLLCLIYEAPMEKSDIIFSIALPPLLHNLRSISRVATILLRQAG